MTERRDKTDEEKKETAAVAFTASADPTAPDNAENRKKKIPKDKKNKKDSKKNKKDKETTPTDAGTVAAAPRDEIISVDDRVETEAPDRAPLPPRRGEGDDGRKVFVTRIPAAFDVASVVRIFEGAFGAGCVEDVAFPTKPDDDDAARDGARRRVGAAGDGETPPERRGFAFVTLSSVEKRDEVVGAGAVSGTARASLKKRSKLFIRPVVREDDDGEEGGGTADGGVCFLWTEGRCPYGKECKFAHEGEGGCVEKGEKKVRKCFAYRSKGKCKLGDKCPFSHDVAVRCPVATPSGGGERAGAGATDKKCRDCINWKSKGKCRKGDRCPYRHDEALRETFLKKKRAREDGGKAPKVSDGSSGASAPGKTRQPLTVRVFGLNYDTTKEDVREYFAECGKVAEVTFPTFEDSGRSKGYCEVLFVSPKATEAACKLDGEELQGRWLRIQPGKMYLKKWAEKERAMAAKSADGATAREKMVGETEEAAPIVGEFGQKVKRRKRHGHKVE